MLKCFEIGLRPSVASECLSIENISMAILLLAAYPQPEGVVNLVADFMHKEIKKRSLCSQPMLKNTTATQCLSALTLRLLITPGSANRNMIRAPL